jgi:hypothetical protein
MAILPDCWLSTRYVLPTRSHVDRNQMGTHRQQCRSNEADGRHYGDHAVALRHTLSPRPKAKSHAATTAGKNVCPHYWPTTASSNCVAPILGSNNRSRMLTNMNSNYDRT